MCDYEVKIVMAGDSSVGKTSLVVRFADDTFAPDTSSSKIDIKSKIIVVDGNKVRVNVVDTAGQEKYRTLTTAYFRGAHAVLMVYSITDKDSFADIDKNWQYLVRLYADEGTTKMLVGNKLDLDAERVVDTETAKTYAGAQDMLCIETSAKTDLNVKKLFETLVRQILKRGNLKKTSSDRGVDPAAAGKGGGGCC